MMYVSQIIILYTLNFYNLVCQLDLNKTGGGATKRLHTHQDLYYQKKRTSIGEDV